MDQAKFRRRVIKTASRMFPGGASGVVPLLARWAGARGEAVLRRGSLVRGAVVVWPYPGGAMAIGKDVARPGRGEVLVKVAASAVSPGTERAFFNRFPNAATKFPFFPGYSAAGEVLEVGRGVGSFRRNDRVALIAEHGSVVTARESELVPVSGTVPLEEAAFVQLAVIALQALDKAAVRPGDPVVVLGRGLIGQLLVQLASVYGAYPVISVGRTARRLTEPLQRCARHIIILDRDGARALDGCEAAATLEATGAPEGVALAIQCTRRGGRIILAGSTRGISERTDFGLIADKGLMLVGAHITSIERSSWLAWAKVFVHLLEHQRIAVDPLISERIHPLEAEWFYRRLSLPDDATIGAIFCWDRLTEAERVRRIGIFALPDFAPLKHGRMKRQPLPGKVPHQEEGAIRA